MHIRGNNLPGSRTACSHLPLAGSSCPCFSHRMEHMTALARRSEAISFALRVLVDPKRDEVTAGGVASRPRVERDRAADPRAVLHPYGKVNEPLEDSLLLCEQSTVALLLDICREQGDERKESGGGSEAKRRERGGEGTRTGDAHRERFPARHEVVQLQRLQETGLLQLLARLHVVTLEEIPMRAERVDALVEAYLRLLRPLRRLCARDVTSARIQEGVRREWRNAHLDTSPAGSARRP